MDLQTGDRVRHKKTEYVGTVCKVYPLCEICTDFVTLYDVLWDAPKESIPTKYRDENEGWREGYEIEELEKL